MTRRAPVYVRIPDVSCREIRGGGMKIAWWCDVQGAVVTAWVPVSTLGPGNEIPYAGACGLIEIEMWMAERKGLIETVPRWILLNNFYEGYK